MNDERHDLKGPFVSLAKAKYDPSARSMRDRVIGFPPQDHGVIKIQVAFDDYLFVCRSNVVELDPNTARK